MNDWIAVSAIVQAIAMILLVIITTGYAWGTYKMVIEMRNARKEAFTPNLQVQLINLRRRAPIDYDLVVQNVGPGPALNIVIKFRIDPAAGSDREWRFHMLPSQQAEEFLLFKGPGEHDQISDINELARDYEALSVKASYKDVFGTTYFLDERFNFRDTLAGISNAGWLMPDDDMHKISESLEIIADNFDSATDMFNGFKTFSYSDQEKYQKDLKKNLSERRKKQAQAQKTNN